MKPTEVSNIYSERQSAKLTDEEAKLVRLLGLISTLMTKGLLGKIFVSKYGFRKWCLWIFRVLIGLLKQVLQGNWELGKLWHCGHKEGDKGFKLLRCFPSLIFQEASRFYLL